MEVRAGYKLTEVGMIPEDWEVKRIADFASVGSGGTPSRAIAAYWNGSIPWITTSQIDFGTIYEAQQFITDEGLQNSAAKLLPAGTLLMALYGQGKTRGKVGVLGSPASTNQACASIALDESVSREFILQYLTSRYEEIRTSSNSGSQENLSGSIVKGLLVASPQLPEQRAIAAALSDVDALLAGLDDLIAKKRDLKQAAMQQLLTGQTRLPGFKGEWLTLPAREVGLFKGGAGFPLRAQGEAGGDYPFFKVSDMNIVGNEIVMTTANHYISETTRKRLGAMAFPAGSIVFAKVGAAVFLERKKILGQASCIDNNMAAFIIDKSRAHIGFVHMLLLSLKLGALVATTALPSLNGRQLGEIPIAVPPLAEQAAIAGVLSDIDAELTALEARREKTRALKQAMMQELLTGRTRLV